MSAMPSEFNSVTLEILWTRLICAVDEAAAALIRTSFSTLVRESHDFSCVITDAEGRSLVQATRSIPSFIGTLPATVKHFIKAYPPETLAPGDVLITNDIFQGTGHLPDITVAKPIFVNDRLIGFSASTAHAPDIAVLADGRFLVGTSKIGKRTVFRPAFSSWRTRFSDVEEFAEVVLEVAATM